MRLFQIVCAILGSWAAIFVGVKNGFIIGVNGFWAAYLGTWLVAKLRRMSQERRARRVL